MCNYKRGLTVFLMGLLASFSFGANALVQLTGGGVSPSVAMSCFGVTMSDVFEPSQLEPCAVDSWHNGVQVKQAYDAGGFLYVYYVKRYSSGGSRALYKSVPSCPSGMVLKDGKCQSICPSLAGEKTGRQKWNAFEYGDSPTVCSDSCTLELASSGSKYFCSMVSGECYGVFQYSGESCSSGDGLTSGGTVPDAIPQSCVEIHENMYKCPSDANGDGFPDETGELDSEAWCSRSGSKFTCRGGSWSKEDYVPVDPTKPIDDANTPPDINSPDNTPIDVGTAPSVDGSNSGDLSGVISAIKDQNRNVNKMMTDLNIDNNKNFSEVLNRSDITNQHLKNINDSLVESTNKANEIFDNTKALSLQSTTDIVQAINDASEFDDTRNDRVVNSLTELKEQFISTDTHTPTSKADIPLAIFSPEDISSIQTENETLKTELSSMLNSAKDIVKISTDFHDGSLSNDTFEIKGVQIKSGLWRFAEVAPYVYPVMIFVCVLIAFFIVFNVRSR